jgi:hypothetical protein
MDNEAAERKQRWCKPRSKLLKMEKTRHLSTHGQALPCRWWPHQTAPAKRWRGNVIARSHHTERKTLRTACSTNSSFDPDSVVVLDKTARASAGKNFDTTNRTGGLQIWAEPHAPATVRKVMHTHHANAVAASDLLDAQDASWHRPLGSGVLNRTRADCTFRVPQIYA